MDGAEAQTCDTHRRRPARGTCVSCSRPHCLDCLTQTRVGAKCRSCGGGSTSHGGSRRRVRRRLRATPTTVALVIGLVGLVATAWLLLSDGEGPDALDLARDTGAEDFTFTGYGGLELAGVLERPPGPGPWPAAVIVGGFGAATRDGLGGASGSVDPLYADIGAALTARGIAVLRYDKRGVGQSVPVPAEPPQQLSHHVEDAQRATVALSSLPDIVEVAVIGHDQGGLIALELGTGDPRPAALVLVGTPGRPLGEVLAEEIRTGIPPPEGPDRRADLAAELEEGVAALLAGEEVPAVSEPLEGALPAGQSAYLRSVFSIDPATVAEDVSGPVLVVAGTADPGITDADVSRLVDALGDATSVEVLRPEGADHTLRVGAEPHLPAPSAGTRDADALAAIADWLRQNL